MKNLLGYSAYMINGFFLHLIPALADVKLDDGQFELLLVRKLSNPLAAFNMLHRIMKRDFDGDSLI